jgi:hypothetical protein
LPIASYSYPCAHFDRSQGRFYYDQAQPTITSLTPNSGVAGTVVTIAGSSIGGADFGATQGSSTVTFNGTNAGTAPSWTTTSITISVPIGATTGNVAVTVNGVASNGVNFTVVAATPTFSPAGGNYLTAQTVTMSTTTSGASIRYTTDGTAPSDTVGTVYSGPVTVSATTTLKAIAYASGYTNSAVATAVYNILAATPTFSPAGGNYLTAQTVTMSTTTSGASIRYTTDGTAPSDTLGTVYIGPVTVSATTTLKAIAYASGYTNSAVATAVYNILAATPTFSPAGGNYLTAQTVTMSTTTSGASIRYTTCNRFVPLCRTLCGFMFF